METIKASENPLQDPLPPIVDEKPVNRIIGHLKGIKMEHVAQKVQDRLNMFVRALNKQKINNVILKSLSFRGIPEENKSLRPILWRILLNQLSVETSNWEEQLL
jgi:hypothetical protein